MKRFFVFFAECLVVAVLASAHAAGATIRLIPPVELDFATFGSAVASVPDVNNDGVDDLAVGAPGSNRAYLFDGVTGAVRATLELSTRSTKRSPRSYTESSSPGCVATK